MDMMTALDIGQIIFADIILSGDNALVIGMAAAGLPENQRKKVLVLGMALAAGLRIFFAVIASWLLAVPGILFIGGLLLAWVCWRFYGEIRHFNTMQADSSAESGTPTTTSTDDASGKTLLGVMMTITMADVSMSIDNVVAVAAIARDNTTLLVFGLVLSIVFMAFCATMIMRLMLRQPMLAWIGLVFLIWLAADMLVDGWHTLPSSFLALITGQPAGGA